MGNLLYKIAGILLGIWLIGFNVYNAGGVNLILLIIAAFAVVLGINQIKKSI